MTTLGDKLRNEKNADFNRDFDLDTFARFIEDRLRENNSVIVGICPDWMFERETLTKYCRVPARWTSNKWLTFVNGYTCGYWNSACQIPLKFHKEVNKWLREQGLTTKLKGLAGFEDYDVIVVSL